MKKILLTVVVLLSLKTQAQVVSWQPYFFTDADSVTIIFDATQGNAALAGTATPVYAHTGVVTNLSATNTTWRYVQGNWATADPKVLMTSIGTNLFQIKYHVRNFYNVPVSEQILRLAFVFRNQAGTIVGRNADGSDIFVPVFSGTYTARIASPFFNPYSSSVLKNLNDVVNIIGLASASSDLKIFNNGNLVAQVIDDSLSANVTLSSYGKNTIRFEGFDGTTTSVDSIYFIVNPPLNIAAVPAAAKDGVTYVNDSTVIFKLTAPFKGSVYVVGDFNNYEFNTGYFMNLSPDSTQWWLQISGLTAGQEYTYQYLVDGGLRIGDPYSEKILDPSNDGSIGAATYPNPTPYPTGKTQGIVTVLQTAQVPYNWVVTNFVKPAKTDLVIYELLIRDFVAAHNYQTLIDTLDYLQELGVNAIELMPPNEFEGNNSWGYNPSFYFAPDKYYGTKNKLKEFIDECHQRGIAVILDVVLNHSCGQSPMVQLYFDNAIGKPASNSPWYNVDPKHDFNVCYDMNHDSPYTRYFVDRVTEYWLTEYKADGYRFDLAKGFTQTYTVGNVGAWGNYDASRVYNLTRMFNHMRTVDPTSYCIFEMFADNSEETVYANQDIMLWGNMNCAYNQATMGFSNGCGWDLTWGSYQARSWNQPSLVTYMESHDEERLMYKNIQFGNINGSYNLKDTSIALDRMAEAAAFFFTIPGPKMVWQFGELGYDYSINFSCRTCPKPIKWNYYGQPKRKRLFDIYKALIDLKVNQPAMESTNYNVAVASAYKSIHINHPGMNVTVLGNFGMSSASGIPSFQSTGYWYEYLTGDSIFVASTTAPIILNAGEYRIYTSLKLPTPVISTSISKEQTVLNYFEIFPNPVSQNFSIKYELLKATDVIISLYDLQGRKISTLIDEQQGGLNEFSFSAKELKLQSGVYMCTININGEREKVLRLVVE